jgi:hypothetical protein
LVRAQQMLGCRQYPALGPRRDLARPIMRALCVSQHQHDRLREEGGSAPSLNLESAAEVLELTTAISTKEKEAEAAGEEGNVDLSLKLMEEVEALKKKKAETQVKLTCV